MAEANEGQQQQPHPLQRPPRRRLPTNPDEEDLRNNLPSEQHALELGEALALRSHEAAAAPPRSRWKGAVNQIIREQRGVSLLSRDTSTGSNTSNNSRNPHHRHHRRLASTTGIHDVLQAMQEINHNNNTANQHHSITSSRQSPQQQEAAASWTDTIINADQDIRSDLNLINHGVLQQVTAEAAEEDQMQLTDESRRLSFRSSHSDMSNGTFLFGTNRRGGRKAELIPLFENLREDDASPQQQQQGGGTSNSAVDDDDLSSSHFRRTKINCLTWFRYGVCWLCYSCCCGRTARLLRKILAHAMYQIRWVLITIPMTISTATLYYHLGNPSPDFLPGVITLSWLGNFLSRHIVLWSLAQLTQFFIIDIFLMASHKLVLAIGPVATLLLLQAKGWPFVSIVWGILALFLLHGNNEFQTHWLYWTGIDVFAKTNSGSYILSSAQYTNFLLGMIVSGFCTAFKRFLLTVYFGRRQFDFFKPRLEKLLADVVLVSEIATLAQAGTATNTTDLLESTAVDWKTVKRTLKDDSNDDDYEDDIMADDSPPAPYNDYDDDDDEDGGTRGFRNMANEPIEDSTRNFGQFKNLLDAWEEPTKDRNNGDFRANIADVLQFKRALTFMDDTYPFGEHFGPSSNRDQCIASSHELYQRLCVSVLNNNNNNNNNAFTGFEPQVPFSLFEPLYVDPEGNVDRKVRAKLKRIFPPMSTGKVDLFTFIQSVDSLYRRLRYFSASVRNDASLDKVLENIVNTFYYLLLGLFLMSLLNYNPWSMLVSITSLLVSLSFAFGQTVSRYVEGILTVAVGRPFDLGDRVYLVNATTAHTGGDVVGATLFVEDINLSKTKLRYAATGEIMYMSNYLLSTMRIYNLNRSPSAVIPFTFDFGIRLLEQDNLEKLRSALVQYIADHPVRWESLVHLRIRTVAAGDELVQCDCSFRHRSPWQNAASIKNHQSELMKFMYDKAMSMGVAYEVSPVRSILYQGGNLQEGVTQSRLRVDLLQPKNVVSLKGAKAM